MPRVPGAHPHTPHTHVPHPHPTTGVLDIEDACRGFLELAKEGAAACVAVVFADPAFADLFQRLYCRWGVSRSGMDVRWGVSTVGGALRREGSSVAETASRADALRLLRFALPCLPAACRLTYILPCLPPHSEEWRGGGVTGSVLATLEDFLQDFERMVQPAFYRRWGQGQGWGGGWVAGMPQRHWKVAVPVTCGMLYDALQAGHAYWQQPVVPQRLSSC